MGNINKFIALGCMLTMFSNQAQAQECCEQSCEAYNECGTASYMSAVLPIGALVVAGVIIATTDRHHSHHSGSDPSSSSSHSHSHAHSGSGL